MYGNFQVLDLFRLDLTKNTLTEHVSGDGLLGSRLDGAGDLFRCRILSVTTGASFGSQKQH